MILALFQLFHSLVHNVYVGFVLKLILLLYLLLITCILAQRVLFILKAAGVERRQHFSFPWRRLPLVNPIDISYSLNLYGLSIVLALELVKFTGLCVLVNLEVYGFPLLPPLIHLLPLLIPLITRPAITERLDCVVGVAHEYLIDCRPHISLLVTQLQFALLVILLILLRPHSHHIKNSLERIRRRITFFFCAGAQERGGGGAEEPTKIGLLRRHQPRSTISRTTTGTAPTRISRGGLCDTLGVGSGAGW